MFCSQCGEPLLIMSGFSCLPLVKMAQLRVLRSGNKAILKFERNIDIECCPMTPGQVIRGGAFRV